MANTDSGGQWPWEVFIGSSDDKPALWVDSCAGNTTRANTAITDTKWHHAVTTVTGTQVRFFLDGNSDGAGVNTCVTNDENVALNIGGDLDLLTNGDTYFEGALDDVRLYNRALSAGEVQQLYLAGK